MTKKRTKGPKPSGRPPGPADRADAPAIPPQANAGAEAPAEPEKPDALPAGPEEPAPAERIEVLASESEEYDELQKAFAALEHDFLRLKQENDELKDRYLRKLAEMDNLRKRVEREKAEFQSFALNAVLRDLLVIADNFGRALSGPAGQDGASFREGVELIRKQLMDFLAKCGVTPVEAAGRAFDPALHQAFDSEESGEVTEPVVAEEMQKGYLLHGRLLRPALVRVLVPKKGD